MSPSLLVLWAVTGWCITGSLRPWWLRDLVPLDTPERPPRPNWLLLGIVGAVGGVIGGALFTQAFGYPVPWITAGPSPEPWMPLVRAAATTVGAFLGGRLAIDFYWLVSGSGNAPRA
jgi:hypothetical protein